jgi:hypothetical protein
MENLMRSTSPIYFIAFWLLMALLTIGLPL